jgi:hypothetical protein
LEINSALEDIEITPAPPKGQTFGNDDLLKYYRIRDIYAFLMKVENRAS